MKRTLFLIVAVLTAGCGTSSYPTIHAADLAREQGCTAQPTVKKWFVAEAVSGEIGGGTVRFYTFHNAAAQRQYERIADQIGATYLSDPGWIIDSTDTNVLETVRARLHGTKHGY